MIKNIINNVSKIWKNINSIVKKLFKKTIESKNIIIKTIINILIFSITITGTTVILVLLLLLSISSALNRVEVSPRAQGEAKVYI